MFSNDLQLGLSFSNDSQVPDTTFIKYSLLLLLPDADKMIPLKLISSVLSPASLGVMISV
jgi:hypothetical protein